MPTPVELRRKAQAHVERAKQLNDQHEKDPSAMGDEARRSFDAEMAAAESAIQEAQAIEDRERRLNAFDAGAKRKGNQAGHEAADDDLAREIRGRKYSLLKAVSEFVAGGKLTGFEAEMSREIALRTGRNPTSFFLPTDIPFDEQAARRGARALGVEHRDLDTTVGAGAIPTVKPATVIEALRNRSVLVEAGAQFFSDLVGVFSLPKQTAVETVEWVAQGTAPNASAMSIGSVDFNPKTIAATEVVTRRMLLQPSVNIEMFARASIMKGLAIGVDRAGLAGAVAVPQLSPVGLLYRSGVTVAKSLGTDGGALDWDAVVKMEAAVLSQNASFDNPVYVTNPKVLAKAKVTPKVGTFPTFLCGDDNTFNGRRVLVTNSVPSNLTKGAGTNLSAMLYGDFSNLAIGAWSAIDVLVDPYTLASAGSIRVVALQDVDIQPRYDEAFSKLVDINTN